MWLYSKLKILFDFFIERFIIYKLFEYLYYHHLIFKKIKVEYYNR